MEKGGVAGDEGLLGQRIDGGLWYSTVVIQADVLALHKILLFTVAGLHNRAERASILNLGDEGVNSLGF